MMSDEVFRFAFITDPQIGMNSPNGLRGEGSDQRRLDVAIGYVEEEGDVDFVLFGGDHINDPEGEQTDEQLDVFVESVSRLTVPYYGVMGNHDQVDPRKLCKYSARGLPVRFTMVHKGCYFLGLNATWLRGDSDACYEVEEWAYIERELGRKPVGCRHYFVVMHWPLFTAFPQEEEMYWNMPNRERIVALFKEHGVSCVFSGHWHQDIDSCWQGVHFITSGGTSLPLQYPEERSFKVVTVFEDGWSVRRVSVEDSLDVGV